MDKTPGQVAIDAWHECGNGFERKMVHVADAVIAHARQQIEREAYEKVMAVRKDYDELTVDEWIKKYGANCTLRGAIRVLSEGK